MARYVSAAIPIYQALSARFSFQRRMGRVHPELLGIFQTACLPSSTGLAASASEAASTDMAASATMAASVYVPASAACCKV